jgi:HlyD family secretion protein
MKKRILLVVLLVALAAAAAAAWWWQREAPRPLRDVIVLHGNVDIRQVELAFNAAGRIEQVLVHEGDRVQKGQLLAVLDSQRLQRAVELAEAQVAAQREVVARLRAGSRPEEISKAKADAESARVDARNAVRTADRLKELAAQRFVPQQQADDARAAADAAEARLKAAAEALLAANRATLAIAQRDLAEASLYAPVGGVIENRVLEPGDMASPQKAVFTLALAEPLWVRAYASGPDLGRIRLGSRATVLTDSYPGKRYRAWVGFISPTAEFTPKSVETQEVRTQLVYQVRVFVCSPQDELRLGMPASVEIVPGAPPEAGGGRGPDPCQNGA